jgi:hypothetical protein
LDLAAESDDALGQDLRFDVLDGDQSSGGALSFVPRHPCDPSRAQGFDAEQVVSKKMQQRGRTLYKKHRNVMEENTSHRVPTWEREREQPTRERGRELALEREGVFGLIEAGMMFFFD